MASRDMDDLVKQMLGRAHSRSGGEEPPEDMDTAEEVLPEESLTVASEDFLKAVRSGDAGEVARCFLAMHHLAAGEDSLRSDDGGDDDLGGSRGLGGYRR